MTTPRAFHTLKLGAHGPDVRRLQRGINARLKARNQHGWLIHEDGILGRQTYSALHHALYLLGAPTKVMKPVRLHKPIPSDVQYIVSRPARPVTWLPAAAWRKAHGALRHAKRKVLPGASVAHPIFGIDYAWGTPNVAALSRAGVKFAVQYISHDPSKDETRAEAVALGRAGISSVLVFETTAGRALMGAGAGRVDAIFAVARAKVLGAPKGACIYAAVDFDETPGQAGVVREYFKAFNAVCHQSGYRSGAYGGYWVCKRLVGVVDLLWQTYAWSGGQWLAAAALRQYSNGHTLAGVSCDFDHAVKADYGQWRP